MSKRVLCFKVLCGVLVALLAVCIFVQIFVPNVLDVNRYRGKIAYQIEKNTGLKFDCENIKLKTSFSPYLNLYAHRVRFLYPSGDTCLKITDANVKIKILPLLFKKIEIDKIILTRPIGKIVLYSDGSTSLDKHLKRPEYVHSKNKFKLGSKIPSVQLNKYKLTFDDERVSAPFLLEGNKFLISSQDIYSELHFIADGALLSKNQTYINYNLDINTYLSAGKKPFELSPFESIKKYAIKGDLNAKLKIREKNNNLNINGSAGFDNMSFKIDNEIFADNSINLAFAGSDVEIDSKIKTGSNEFAVVMGKFSYGSKKFVDLKVKMKQANISNLHNIVIALCDTCNIKNRYRNFNVTGLADFDFNIKSDLKKIESSGMAKIINASIKSRVEPIEITSINSNINFSNNNIKINETKALVNSTPVNIKGSIGTNTDMDIHIDSTDLLLSNLCSTFLKSDKYKDYRINGGKVSFDAILSGKINKPEIKLKSNIDMLNMTNIKQKFDIRSKLVKLDLYNSKNDKFNCDIVFSDFGLKGKKQNALFQINDFRISVDDKNLVLPQTTVNFLNSSFSVYGSCKNYRDKPELKLQGKGNLRASDLYDIFKEQTSLKAGAKGILPFVFVLSTNEESTKFQIQSIANKDNYLSFLVIKELLNIPSIVNISGETKNNILTLSDLSLYKLKSAKNLSENLASNINQAVKVVSLSGKILDFQNFKVENFKIFIPEALSASVSGFKNSEISVKSDITLDGFLTSPKIAGNLFINSLSFPEYNLFGKNILLFFENSLVNIKSSGFNIDDSNFEFTATAVPSFDKALIVKNITLKSPKINLSNLINSFSKLFSQAYMPGVSVPVIIEKGNIEIAKFQNQNIEAKDVKSEIALNENILYFKKLSCNAYGGDIYGDISYNFLSLLTRIQLNGRALDAAPSFSALTGIKDDIAGKTDFSADVKMYGYTKTQQMQSLKGSANITAMNGQLNSLGKFEHFLYAQNLLSQSIMKSTINQIAKAVAPKNTGLFRYLIATVNFEDGYAKVSDFQFSGPNMSMYLRGKMNLLNNTADFEILGKVSEEVTNVLGPLGQLSLSNIISNVNMPNLFFNNYNLQVPQSTLDKIPQLTPKTQLKTRNFTVRILGDMTNVKSVKSFKWLVLSIPKTNNDVQSQTSSGNVENQTSDTINTVTEKRDTIPVNTIRVPNNQLPDFLNDLPDSIN